MIEGSNSTSANRWSGSGRSRTFCYILGVVSTGALCYTTYVNACESRDGGLFGISRFTRSMRMSAVTADARFLTTRGVSSAVRRKGARALDLKSLRWSVAVISLVGVLVVLFGGYYAYRQFGLDRPMTQALRAEPGVQAIRVSDDGGTRRIEVSLGPVNDLQTTYDHLEGIVQDYVSPGHYDLVIVDHRSQYLEDTYYRMQFLVREGLARGNYEAMYGGLQTQADQLALDSFKVYVGDGRVYLQLGKGSDYLYAVVTRTAGTPEASAATGGVGL